MVIKYIYIYEKINNMQIIKQLHKWKYLATKTLSKEKNI